jgi:hypothetical protein
MATYPARSLAEQPFGLIGLGGLLSPTESWDADALYLQSDHSGYIPTWGKGPPLRRAIAEVKSFAGLGIATFLFDPEGKPEFSYGMGSGLLGREPNQDVV